MDWSRAMRPEIVGILVPVVALLVAGAIVITKMIATHRERLAMIERGMDPDASKR